MQKHFVAMLLTVLPLAALGQAPVPTAPTPITADPGKGGASTPPPTQRSSAARPGAAPPPMNIRIRDEGIKLPACTAESREGEACKK